MSRPLLPGASLVAQLVKNPPAVWETRVRSLVGKIPWRRARLPTPVFWPGEFRALCSSWGRRVRHDWVTFTHWLPELSQVALVVKNLPANAEAAGDMCSIPGLGRCPGERNSYPFQYSCLGNLMDRWAWEISSTEESGRPQSRGLHSVRHDWVSKPHSLSSITHVPQVPLLGFSSGGKTPGVFCAVLQLPSGERNQLWAAT